MNTQFVTDTNGNKLAAIVPMKQYNKMLEELDMFDDVKLYDQAKKGKQQFKSAKDVFNEIEKND